MADDGSILGAAIPSPALTERRSVIADTAAPPPLTDLAKGAHSQKFQRARPSAAEHERRVEWGHEWGPKVGASIRAYIAAAERA